MRFCLIFLLLTPVLLIADGGIVQFRKEAGPFVVTLFSSPSPLRAGPADLSVLVEAVKSREAILDAAVALELRNQSGRQISAAATHGQATNKLLYAALPDISEAGEWNVRITVTRESERAVVDGDIQVVGAPPAIVEYWPYFAIVPVLIGLFILNQLLKARQRGKFNRV